MQSVSLKDLLEAGCHFGHKADRWHPKAERFIYQEREGIHIIDLAKTKTGLEAGAEFIKKLTSEGKNVLFLGTKRQAAAIVAQEAQKANAPYFSERWIGGFLTNWTEIHKNLEKIRRLTEEEKNNTWKKYPKHERVKLSRYLKRLNTLYGGVVALNSPPDALVVVDVRTEAAAIAEARRRGIAIIGVVDTNSNPDLADIVIPSNDDAVGAIKFIVTYLLQAYVEGREAFDKEKVKHEKQKQAEALQPEKKVQEVAKPVVKKENTAEKAPEKKEAVEEKPVRKEVKKEKKLILSRKKVIKSKTENS